MFETFKTSLQLILCYLVFGVVLFWPIERCWPRARPGQRETRGRELAGVAALFLAAPCSLFLTEGYLRPVFNRLSGGYNPIVLFESSGLLGSVLRIGLLVVVCDFLNYWVHRWMHTSVGWHVHYLHHLPKDLNWRTGLLATPI